MLNRTVFERPNEDISNFLNDSQFYCVPLHKIKNIFAYEIEEIKTFR